MRISALALLAGQFLLLCQRVPAPGNYVTVTCIDLHISEEEIEILVRSFALNSEKLFNYGKCLSKLYCYTAVFTCPTTTTISDPNTYPDPTNCSYYYTCSNGAAVRTPCPLGLNFNPTTHVCDWPANAGCSSEAVTSQCAPQGLTNPGGLYSDPVNCSRYYQCASNVTLYHMACPQGLQFSPSLLTCVYPPSGCGQCELSIIQLSI